ncbi:MAG TPA: transglutaminase-like domain-containing protein, partial [Longilinea sp.]|nr:transglutaminase-like domain-containing protein [Longilinea sp.]
ISETIKDVMSIIPARVIDRGDDYQAVGWLVNPSIVEMRSAGSEYPDWVLERYLQLPTGFSQQVIDLASQITAEAETTYDQVMAVTQYLRSNITYASTIIPAPANEDIIEWFLFEQQHGFCTYYASAEVLMLRSLGIPARLVVGYAEGIVTPDQMVFHVRQLDSHAWPEVFFPNIGWVIFEPTASLPQTDFSEGPAALATEVSAEELAQAYQERVSQSVQGPAFAEMETGVSQEFVALLPEQPHTNPLLWYLLGVFSVAFGGVTFWYTRVRKTEPDLKYFDFIKRVVFGRQVRLPDWLMNWINYLRMSPTEKAYTRLNWMVRWLGGGLAHTQTPAERLEWLAAHLPEAEPDVNIVLDQIQRSRFSQDLPDDSAAKRSGWKVFWLALKFGLKQRLSRKVKKS